MVKVTWKPSITKEEGPAYLAIANALEADILSGAISAGLRLPPQRSLAGVLGLDFTTISRAYAEARARGLVEARVGQGTYVKSIQTTQSTVSAMPGLVDMGMNQPPPFDNPALQNRMTQSMAYAQQATRLDLLMRYQIAGGTKRDREAGRQWLSPLLPDLDLERLIVSPGAQGALLAILSQLAKTGDVICTESLTYPGMRALAAQLSVTLHPLAMDDRGIVPDAFEKACIESKPKALYVTPTLHNPTTLTMPLQRRQALATIAQRHCVPIIEDDAYGALPSKAVPPIATFAPELTYYIGSLAKCVSPALRIAYLVAPNAEKAAHLISSLRATACMASPLTANLASQWIEDGTAKAIVTAVRQESIHRQKCLQSYLPADRIKTDQYAFHAWLSLPSQWQRGEFITQLRSAGVSVVGSDAFTHHDAPQAVRLGLGSPDNRADLEASLKIIADLLTREPALNIMVV
ncbi:MAG: PLP-dependent aminotransferase family protein [Cohaesibacter sp.]|nr:PLP-dependent aminotransferase family protein [Cohaesibacter sp.]